MRQGIAKHGLRSAVFVMLLMTAGWGCRSSSETGPSQPRSIAAVDSLIERAIEQEQFSGAAIRVQRGDSLLHRKAYGYAYRLNMELQKVENPEAMTPHHLFDLASLTKVMATTFGVMLMVDRGKLQLDAPIYRWLPAFSEGPKQSITVRHLLTHTAGLYQWKPTYYYASSREQQYAYISNLPLRYEVGGARHYSDLGFMLLAEIIERISGQPLNQYLRRQLYDRLGLAHTVFNPLEKGYEKVAATSHGNPFERHMVYDDSFGYRVEVDSASWDGWRDYTLQGEVNDGNAWYAAQGIAGHAGLFSTVDELQKLVTLLLDKGRYGDRQIISSSVVDTFLTKNRFGNGLGWAMDPHIIAAAGAPPGTFGHTGFTGTNIVAVPRYDLSIIFLTNRQHVGVKPSGHYHDLDPLRQKIFDAVLAAIR